MIVRLAYLYFYALVAFMSLLLALLVALDIALLAGGDFQPGGHLFAVFFAINLPALTLAEDRNIWAHEIQKCQRWMRWLLTLLFAYTILVAVFGVALGSGPVAPANFALAIVTFMLMFTVGCACVLFATFKSAKRNVPDLLKRTRTSLMATSLFGTLAYLRLFVFPTLPHSH
jgi:hypothetical protein